MSHRTSIEWTESSWNPVTGCSKISTGCKHCYAERMAERLRAMGQPNYKSGFDVTLHRHMLELPLRWKKPQTIFVNSMSDLFHEKVPPDFIHEVFDVMRQARWHRFQLLTKRRERLAELNKQLIWPDNVWMGVSVENQDFLHRVDVLRDTNAAVKMLSIEPMLGAMNNLCLRGIDWVIVGGESGPGARPLKQEWVVDVRDACADAHVAFFFKQWGGTKKKKKGRLLEGKTYDAMPGMQESARTECFEDGDACLW